jgi:hypothetical protein
MPIFASNFTSNSLSGTTTVAAGNVTINLSSANFALEGDRTFVVKLRKVSSQGAVIATSPIITIKDTTTFVSLTANTATVAEGNLVSFSLVTTNVINGAIVYYSVLPATANVTADDFTANTGSVVITNNAATFALQANADVSLVDETGETFKVQLRTNSPTGNVVFATSNITILDTYKTYNVLSFVENSAASIPEGSNVTFTFTATNIPAGTILFYSTSGNTTNFSSNTGSFVMNGTSNTFVISNPQVPTNASRTYNAIIRDGSAQGAIVATSNTIVVVDGGLLYMTATGGTITDSGGYRIHTFTTSGNLVISSTGASPTYSTINYLLVGGDGGRGQSTYGAGGEGGGGVLVGNVTLTTGNLSIVIGAAGTSSPASSGTNGGNTSISSPSIAYNIFALGGGGGGGGPFPAPMNGQPGGNGGGGGGGGSSATGGTAYKPVITGATSYGNSGGMGSPSGFGGGGGGGSSAIASTSNAGGGGGIGNQSYDGQASPYPASLGYAGRGFDAGPIGFPGGPFGAGGSASYQYETKVSSRVLIKYVYVAGPTFSSLTSNVSASTYMGEDEEIYFTLNTLNLSSNTLLYYATVGNVISSNFVSGNTGSFRSTGNSTIFVLRSNTNIPTNQERYFQIQVNSDGIGEAAAITSNVYTIKDDALMPVPQGQIEYTTAGTYSFTVPKRVSNVSVVAVGGGGAGGNQDIIGVSGAGGGGALSYVNNIPVVAGNSYIVIVGVDGIYAGRRGGDSNFANVCIAGGGNAGDVTGPTQPSANVRLGGIVIVGAGGSGGNGAGYFGGGGTGWGGGGAGGYTGNGGNGARTGFDGQAGSGGGGGGGTAPPSDVASTGGGVGIYGQGANGVGGATAGSSIGGGGSGGTPGTQNPGAVGGKFGGGGNYGDSTRGGVGAVRIIWGTGRMYPNNAANVSVVT